MLKSIVASFIVFAALPAFASTFGGVGITIQKTNNNVIVLQVLQGTPADEAGVQTGDIIKKVDDNPVTGKSLAAVANAIRGPEGTRVDLTVGDAQGHDRTLEIMRGEITDPSCFLEGPVNLSTNSADPLTNPPTWIWGYVGNTPINGTISGNTIMANIQGQLFYLTFQDNGSMLQVSGFIRGSYVNWFGSGNLITGYQTCIQ